ncbi:MAG: LptF/LptG family permease [Planctomycetota bacterium]|nr:MAG: LptF/LptG family permease [Planctomycetota bacterium]
MLSLLDRVILREVAGLMALYSLGFLGLIAMAVSVPLIRGGAPILDVLLFVPNQLAFPATLVIPLALIAALLSVVARLREDGELIALMAAGISARRLVWSTMPLVLICLILVTILAHVVMPQAYRNFYTGKASLLRQAMATQVARKEPFHQEFNHASGEQLTLTALDAQGQVLKHVFAWHIDSEGQLSIGYAPSANWNVKDGESLPGDGERLISSLQLQLRDGRLMRLPRQWTAAENELPYPHMVGSIPNWSLAVDQEIRSAEHRSEGKGTRQLAAEIVAARLRMAEMEGQNRAQLSLRRNLRDLELFYHTRFLLSGGLICWWLFALGLALTLPARNRMTAIAIGLGVIIITVLPAFALVKGLRGHLHLNPAYLLYSPALVLGCLGAWLIHRRR